MLWNYQTVEHARPTTASLPGLTCYQATVSCPNTTGDLITFGYEKPSQNPPNGTIVLFSGAGGTTASATPGSEASYAQAYLSQGYTVVQLAWLHDWETTNWDPVIPNPYNIQTAACLPATFLHYVRYGQNPVMYSAGGMCAQGASAGSAALAYSVAWYGAADPVAGYLDKLELISGPVFSDIAQGCYVPPPPQTVTPVNICSGNPSYCVGWPSGGLSESPSYVMGTEHSVGSWTGDSSCRGSQSTTQASYNNWLAQSIVNGPNGGGGSFNYSKTAMGAWLCSSDVQGTYNNSAPEGWLFYYQVGQQSSPPIFFNVTAVGSCSDPEGVGQGIVVAGAYAGQTGFNAISSDMADPRHTQTSVCHQNPGH